MDIGNAVLHAPGLAECSSSTGLAEQQHTSVSFCRSCSSCCLPGLCSEGSVCRVRGSDALPFQVDASLQVLCTPTGGSAARPFKLGCLAADVLRTCFCCCRALTRLWLLSWTWTVGWPSLELSLRFLCVPRNCSASCCSSGLSLRLVRATNSYLQRSLSDSGWRRQVHPVHSPLA